MVWMQSFKHALKWGFLAGILTAIVTLFLPDYYRSEARILPLESKGSGSLGNLAAAAMAFGVGVPGQDGGDTNFVDILNSRWMKERLLLTTFPINYRSWRFGEIHTRKETLQTYLHAKNIDQAAARIGQVLFISRDLKSRVLTIGAETQSPELSKMVVEKTCDLLEEFVQKKKRTRGGVKTAFAEARLIDARKEMDQAESAFRQFLEVNRNYQMSGDPSVRLGGSRLEMELKLRQQLVTTISLNREQSLMEEKDDIPILNVLDTANLPIDKNRPSRSSAVLIATFLTTAAAWAWYNRDWVRRRLTAEDSEEKDL